jgi:hypothetical protein
VDCHDQTNCHPQRLYLPLAARLGLGTVSERAINGFQKPQ